MKPDGAFEGKCIFLFFRGVGFKVRCSASEMLESEIYYNYEFDGDDKKCFGKGGFG